MKKIISVSIIFLFIYGCSWQSPVTVDELKSTVTRAASGIRTANDSLSGLFSMNPPPGIVQEILVDTITISGKLFYGVAAQFNNPLQNRFALYDENYKCYLIDKSINGTLKLDAINEIDLKYFSLEETFYSNGGIRLQRFSMFRGDTSGFDLAFRTYITMKTTDTVFTHNLYEITSEMIRTNISAPQFSGLNNLNDDYPYDGNLKKYYVKKAIYFDEFVTDFVKSIKDEENRFIPASNPKSRDVEDVFRFTSGNTPEYYLSLDEDWKELRNKPGGSFLKKDITGSKFVNEKLKADIYVFKIPYEEQAEDYFSIPLESSVNGNYTVRYSKEYTDDDHIKKYFEYSCSPRKFLLLLSAVKETFQENKNEYFEIINTFYIDC
jgi:hypothetical protein